MPFAISLFLIVVGAATMVALAVQKFPQLANLDIASLPAEREFRKKREIVAQRMDTEGRKIRLWLARHLAPLARGWKKLQLQFRVYVGKVERLWHHEVRAKTRLEPSVTRTPEQEAKGEQLVREGDLCAERKEYQQAEELFIAAIKLNQANAAAYRGLADTYLATGALSEAKETYRFLLSLESGNDLIMVKLGEIAEEEGNNAEAISWYQQAVVQNDALSPRFYHLAELLLKEGQPGIAKEAVMQALELEPRNPKYLDLLIETGILCGEKGLALDAYHELRLANPDNQKLKSFKERIYTL